MSSVVSLTSARASRAHLLAQAKRLREACDSVAGLSHGLEKSLSAGFALAIASQLADEVIEFLKGSK